MLKSDILIIISPFDIRSIHRSYLDESIEEIVFRILAVAEVPTVKLPAIFIQVELQKSFVDLFVYSINGTSTFSGYDMNPRKNSLHDFVLVALCLQMRFMVNNVSKSNQVRTAISYDLCTFLQRLGNIRSDGFMLPVRDGEHLDIVNSLLYVLLEGLLVELRCFINALIINRIQKIFFKDVINRFALSYNKDSGFLLLPLISGLLIRLYQVIRGKIRNIQFYLIGELVLCISLAHNIPILHHHEPDRWIRFHLKLILYFLCGKHLLDGCHHVGSEKPVIKRKVTMFHYRTLGQRYSASTIVALERVPAVKPQEVMRTAPGAAQSNLLTNIFEVGSTATLVREFRKEVFEQHQVHCLLQNYLFYNILQREVDGFNIR